MHYYKFNIGDYASHTRHLSLMEDLAYRRLLDAAYTSEKPLSKDVHSLSRLIGMRDYQSEIEDVLKEFFEEVEEGWIHGRILKEIDEASVRSDKAKIAAKARWECKRNADAMHMQCSSDASSTIENASSTKNDATHYPLHTTQDTLPITKDTRTKNLARGSRLPPDWKLPMDWGNWALQEKQGCNAEDIRKCAERFKDYWISVAGAKGVKADWQATWRTWVRRDTDIGRRESKGINGKILEAERILGKTAFKTLEMRDVTEND